MTLRSAAASLALVLAPCLVTAAAAGECAHCPKTVFCRTKSPNIKYKNVCPKPVCCPCGLEHFGYYPTCWAAWPFAQDYSHCALPPAGMLVAPPVAAPAAPPASSRPSELLPPPKVSLLLP